VTTNVNERDRFIKFINGVALVVGHNLLGYDYPIINRLLGVSLPISKLVDTLILSRLVQYCEEDGTQRKHSLKSWGERLGVLKTDFSDFSKYTEEMEEYCVQDVRVCKLIYQRFLDVIDDPLWQPSITLEHQFQFVVNALHKNGFHFNVSECSGLLARVTKELKELDEKIESAFPPKLKLLKEITPKFTKHGTLSKIGFKFVKDGDLSSYNGGPFCLCSYIPFNPSSTKQIVEVLNTAGWKPKNKTKTHIETERELKRLQYQKGNLTEVDLRSKELHNKLQSLSKIGWKIDETNLDTLPASAPSSAKVLARRILLESRRRTLAEWLSIVREDSRIHGRFQGIGCWTHRMAHQEPNTANIPTAAKLYGAEMRSLWNVPKSRLLVGCDAEGIQLRIFAHYINDKEFTNALVNGRKENKTDPHSLNQRVLGDCCINRQTAKRFIFALLLGAGIDKLAEILSCGREQCTEALERLLVRYPGFAYLKEKVIPADADRGFFVGLDGRRVRIPGNTVGIRKHLCMSGYLQNGEAVVMKKASVYWSKDVYDFGADIVNLVHDEWQTECPNNMSIALAIAKMQADSLRIVGEELKLNCPLAGSYYNEDNKDYTIGVNWQQTH
jgi:DNA polymerase-1